MRFGLLVVMACGLTGCGDAGGIPLGGDTDDFIDVDTPPSNCSAESGADPCPDPDSTGGGIGEGDPCANSQQCAAGMSCIAPFEGGQAVDFTCTAQCIANEDESAWCLDSTACCAWGAVCTARGLCVGSEGVDDTGSSTDSGSTGGSGTDGSGTDSTGSGTDSGSTGGSGTDSSGSGTEGAGSSTGMQ